MTRCTGDDQNRSPATQGSWSHTFMFGEPVLSVVWHKPG